MCNGLVSRRAAPNDISHSQRPWPLSYRHCSACHSCRSRIRQSRCGTRRRRPLTEPTGLFSALLGLCSAGKPLPAITLNLLYAPLLPPLPASITTELSRIWPLRTLLSTLLIFANLACSTPPWRSVCFLNSGYIPFCMGGLVVRLCDNACLLWLMGKKNASSWGYQSGSAQSSSSLF